MTTVNPQPPATTPAVTTVKPNPLVAILSAPALLTLISLIGLIVLIALGKVSADVGVPVITGLTGVHLGAAVTS